MRHRRVFVHLMISAFEKLRFKSSLSTNAGTFSSVRETARAANKCLFVCNLFQYFCTSQQTYKGLAALISSLYTHSYRHSFAAVATVVDLHHIDADPDADPDPDF
jgi:hypothetical protein